jgi:hypothetical protein
MTSFPISHSPAKHSTVEFPLRIQANLQNNFHTIFKSVVKQLHRDIVRFLIRKFQHIERKKKSGKIATGFLLCLQIVKEKIYAEYVEN